MHIKKLSDKVRCLVLVAVVAFTTTLGMFVGYQHSKINKLQHQLELKQMTDARAGDSVKVAIDTKSLEVKLNELADYKIFEGKINVQHRYNYNRDAILGLKKKGTLVGNALIYFQYDVRLSNADVTVKDNTINVKIPSPRLNRHTVHRVENTLLFTEESKTNILMNSKDGIDMQRAFEDSLDKYAKDEIEKYYREEKMQEELKDYAKKEIKELLRTLGYTDFNINIEFK